MKSKSTALRFFLGANTPQGFVSRFDQLADVSDGWRTFIIKGGPGCGKSTLIGKIADSLQDDGLEYIHCSSDVDSLDGIISHRGKFSVVDGTKPHILEPKYPGVVESVIDMSSCWDTEILYQHRDEIITLTDKCSRCHEYCCRFLCAAGSLVNDTYRMALETVNTQKLAGYCTRLAEKELKSRKGKQGKESVRFFSAVTNKGIVVFTDTAKALCERIYLISDEYGAVSRLILRTMRSKALAEGYDVISCFCPLSPFDKMEQMFIPQLGIGFMTSNRFHDFTQTIEPYRIVNSQRFTDNDSLKQTKKRMTFNRKSAAQMVYQAESLISEAKEYHDSLEELYVSATDYDKVSALTEKTIQTVHSIL